MLISLKDVMGKPSFSRSIFNFLSHNLLRPLVLGPVHDPCVGALLYPVEALGLATDLQPESEGGVGGVVREPAVLWGGRARGGRGGL